MVHLENCTTITEIVLVGFKPFETFRILLFIVFLIIYLCICYENLLIIYLILSSIVLKGPMFFFIQNMSICQLVIITNVIPKLLNDIVGERPTFTVFGCIAQLHVYGTTGNVYCLHYALMSYDRYLAICSPLHYSSIVNNSIYLKAIVAFWIFSFICTSVITLLESQLQFCGQNIIDHFYCDFSPFISLASSDTTYPLLAAAVVGALVILFTVSLFIVTYILIIHSVFKIPSTSGRKKTFSTCSSHLIAVSLEYTLALGAYLLVSSTVASDFGKMFFFVHFFWSPLMTPVLYSFRNKMFRVEFMRKMKAVGIF